MPGTTGPGSSAGVAQGVSPAVMTILRLAPGQRAGQVADPSATEREQMVRGLSGAAVVVDDDRREGGRRFRLQEDDRRARGRQLGPDRGDVGPELGRGEDDAFDPVRDHELDDRPDVHGVGALDLLEQDPVARRLGLLGDPVERLGDAEVAQAGDDDAKRLGAPLDEAAGDRAGLEAGRRDRGLDGFARLGATRPGAC